MFLVKLNGQNRAYNCIDVMKNIETSKIIVDNFISINSIFIENNKDKSYFYYNKKGLIKNELTKENFEIMLRIIF